MRRFLDLKVGDRVMCLDEYSGGTSYHELIIDSIEDDSEYATESNPSGRRYFGTDQDYLDENGEFNEGDNEYLTVVEESNFVCVIDCESCMKEGMVEIKVLNHSVVIRGSSFEECKAEYNRIINGVKKDFKVESDFASLIFSDMTDKEDECIAIFRR